MSDKRLSVSMSPHIRHGRTVRGLILTTIAALSPACVWGLYQFGWPVLVLLGVGVAGTVVTEAAVCAIARQKQTVGDFHAVLVGLMLVMMVPAGVPWWLVGVGGIMSILVGKMPFGPLGGSPLSPALVGLVIVATSFTAEIRSPLVERTADAALKTADAARPEDPLSAVSRDASDHLEYDRLELFLGLQTGPWGTISPLLLLLGGLFLLWRRVIRWQAPLGFFVGVWLAATVTHSLIPSEFVPADFQLLTGMTFFGAFFLCTEWSTTPVTSWGLFWYGLMAGVLAIVLRVAGVPYGRVPFAILVTSLATPLFDRITATPFGKVVDHA